MERYIKKQILADLSKKIILISGPRQTGKTTLSKMLIDSYDYLNYDNAADRLRISEQSWDRKEELVIFDEIHKMSNWKSFLKGIFDVEGLHPKILVTGSARLDTVRKVGDSLAGRYFQFRLHPLDLKELKGEIEPDDTLERLLMIGGFPEPFLENDIRFYKRWKKTHLDIILRQDLIDLESMRDIQGIETLIQLLKSRVGSTVSYSSLARDLGKDHKTIKKWLIILENLYVIFPVSPWHRNIARAILKEPKYYFYDTGQVEGDEGIRLENVVASSLLKELDYLTDVLGYSTSLHFIQNKQKQEIDFAVQIDNKITHFFEVKLSDTNLSRNFNILLKEYPDSAKVQLVKNISKEKTFPGGEEVRRVADYLTNLDLRTDS